MAEGNCIVCGSLTRVFKSSGLHRLYCSRKCCLGTTARCRNRRARIARGIRPKRRYEPGRGSRKRIRAPKSCASCGCNFVPKSGQQINCTIKCGIRKSHRAARAAGRVKPYVRQRGPFVCQGCGKSYFATCSQKGQGEQFCSRTCSTKHRFRLFVSKRELICRVWFRSCSVCSKPFTCRMPSAKYCSRRCALIYESPKCTICGAFKEGGAWYRTCGKADCNNAYAIQQRDKKRELRSAMRRLRRARMKTDKATLVFRVKVFEACNWKCCSCGCDAPRRLLGTMDDNAPELDHRVALANGGTHDMNNCQLLCRVCNHFKSDKSPSEWEKWKCRGQESQLQS